MDWIGLDVMGEGWDGRRILDGCTGDESGNGWEVVGGYWMEMCWEGDAYVKVLCG